MFRIIGFCIIILVFGITISHAYELAYRDNGIDIIYSSITYDISKNINGEISLNIPLNEYGVSNIRSKYKTSEITILFAIPQNAHLTYKINSKHIKEFSGVLAKFEGSSAQSKNLKFAITLKKIGKMRNVNIAELGIQPVEYSEGSHTIKVIDEISLSIDYGVNIHRGGKVVAPGEFKYFAQMANPDQVFDILSSESVNGNKNNYNQILESNWYNPAKQYVELLTTRDGIAYANLSDILLYLPDILGKSPGFLHIIHRGQESYLKYLDNGNGIIDANDSIYFMGRRAYGDTTWFENYTANEAFFLYYDEQNASLRFNDFPDVGTPLNNLEEVFLYKHIEKEKLYHRGFPQESSETQPGEGWFWSVISPSKGWISEFSDTLFLLPPNNKANIDLAFQFASCIWNPSKENLQQHILEGEINNQFIAKDSFFVHSRDSLKLLITKDKYFPGYNLLKVSTLPYDEGGGAVIEPNQVGADYYTYAVVSRPFAEDGSASFAVKSTSTNKEVFVPGFTDKNIFVVDTINNYFHRLNADAGFFAVVTADFGKATVSMRLDNKKIVYANKRGFYIAYGTSVGKYESKFFEFADDSASDFLNSIPENSFLMVAFNAEQLPAQSVIDYFKSIGSSDIDKINGNDQWVLFGFNNNIYEQYSATNYASVSGFLKLQNGQSYQASLKLDKDYESGLIFDDNNTIEKARLAQVNSTNLKDINNQADVIVVTNKKFINSAKKYIEYRQTTNPEYKFMLIDVDDIYKEFTDGKKTPHAYKDLFRYAFNNWEEPKLKYVFLWGDASWDARKIQKNSINEDYVSTYGWPASDYWFALLDDEDFLPDIQVSRLPITSDDQGLWYINKLVLNDTSDDNPWMKKFLMLTGGQTEEEIERYYNFGKNIYLEDNIANTNLCADTMMIHKKSPSNVSVAEGGEIQLAINDGVQWVYYFGHASARVFDMDGWQSNKLNNKGKYGYLSTLACNTAAFAEPDITTRSEEYVLEKDKGFIGSGGSTNVSWEDIALKLGLLMMQSFSREEMPTETYLEALWYAKERIIYSIEERITSMHYEFLGDPLVKLKFHKVPDFYFVKQNIKIENQKQNSLFTVNDTLRVTADLFNLGHRYYNPVYIKLFHQYRDEKDTLVKTFYGQCYPLDFTFELPLGNNPGVHYFTMVIDPDSLTGDVKISNNSYRFSRTVFNNAVLSLDPLPNWNVKNKDIHFRVINPSANSQNFDYKFKIFSSADTSVVPVYVSNEDEITITQDYIDWQPDANLETNKNYWLGIVSHKLDDNSYSPISIIPFNTNDNNTNENVLLTINNSSNFALAGESKGTTAGTLNNTSGVFLEQTRIPFSLYSVFGSENSPNRDAEIAYDGKIYITVPPDILGFKIVAVSADSIKPYAVRNYNTYDNVNNAEQFVRFIKDSISAKDYLLLTTNGESIRAFKTLKYTRPESIGSLDSLKFYMRNYYGSVAADSFDTEMGSYCMLARKLYNHDSTRESVNYAGDTARIDGYIIDYSKQGIYSTYDLGPAKKWESCKLMANVPANSNITANIFGYNVKSFSYDKLMSANLVTGTNEIDLSDIDTGIYPQLKFEAEFARDDESSEPALQELQFKFVPVPELLISASGSSLSLDTILRGEDMQANLFINNISLRSKIDSSNVDVRVESKSKFISKFSIFVPNVDRDGSVKVQAKEISDNYDELNIVSCELNRSNQPYEMYRFNNTAVFSQHLVEDTIKPEIVFKLDGREVQEGDNVTRVPYIEVELLDNSPIEIKSVEKINIGINRPFPGDYDTVFTSYARNVPLKAKLEFYSDTLDYGENYFRIFVYDAAGNGDTLLRKVFVSKNASINELTTYPNPFNEQVNIEFYLSAPENEGTINVLIYNIMGQLIRKLTKTARVGENTFVWDGRDESGAFQASGLYAYIVRVKSKTYVEPVTGKMLLVK